MRFEEWVDSRRGEQTRTSFLRDFSERTEVSLQTLQFLAKGGRMSLYGKAKVISEATGDKVSVAELCEKV